MKTVGANRTIRASVVRHVQNEQFGQWERWGEQNHAPLFWLAALMEEVGEASQAVIDPRVSLLSYRTEMIHVAAVALSALESLYRNELSGWGTMEEEEEEDEGTPSDDFPMYLEYPNEMREYTSPVDPLP